MACYTCKKGTSIEVNEQNDTNIFVRILYFLLGVVIIGLLTPVIVSIGVYMLFNTMVLDKSTNIMPSFTMAAQLLNKITNKKVDNDEEEDDYEELNPDDYELIGVEEINKKNV